jgi:hypothetical protein
MLRTQMINSNHAVVVVVEYVLATTKVVPVVEGRKVDSLTGVKPKKGWEDMGSSPGTTTTVEETKENPIKEIEIIKTTEVNPILTVGIEEMISKDHGEDPTRIFTMPRRAKDKVKSQWSLPPPSYQLMQGTVEPTGEVLVPTNSGIMVTTTTITKMMDTSRNSVTMTNPGKSTITLTMTPTLGNLTTERLMKEEREKARTNLLARSRKRLESNLKSKLLKSCWQS